MPSIIGPGQPVEHRAGLPAVAAMMHGKVGRSWLPAVVLAVVVAAVSACGGSNGDDLPFGLAADRVVSAPRVSEIVFAPDGRMFFSEQDTGFIRVVTADGDVQEEPFAEIEVGTHLGGEWGLTSIALHPDFASNGYVYAFYSAPVLRGDTPTVRPTIARLTDDNGVGTELSLITNDFPVTLSGRLGVNTNGKIRFGPDGYLYASFGDYDYEKDGPGPQPASQDLSIVMGSLIRIDPDTGEATPGNPYEDEPTADPRIFAHGFREPFPFAFHPETSAIYGTDNTTVTCEQLNVIEAGANYGWPDVGEFAYEDCDAGDHRKPIYHFAQEDMEPHQFLSFTEISSIAFVEGGQYEQIADDALFVCERGPGILRRVVLAPPAYTEVTADDVITRDCHLAVAAAPDGTVYYASETHVIRLLPSPTLD